MDQKAGWDGRLDFVEIVRRVLGEGNAQGQTERCPDVYVGRLCDIPRKPSPSVGRWQFAVTESARSQRPPKVPCIVLVLESPHKDEYGTDFSYLPWPANGATGGRIQARAPELAAALGVPEDRGVVLLNAIPYQCSQGGEGKWKRRRDEIFVCAWNSGGREFFRERLQSWVQEGDVVVNACTAGTSRKTKLRDLVEEELVAFGGTTRVSLARMHHPPAWTNRRLTNHFLAG